MPAGANFPTISIQNRQSNSTAYVKIRYRYERMSTSKRVIPKSTCPRGCLRTLLIFRTCRDAVEALLDFKKRVALNVVKIVPAGFGGV